MPDWSHEVVFPLIANLIEEYSKLRSDFMTRDEIAAKLAEDRVGRGLIRRVSAINHKSTEWNSGNMVDWFSASWTGMLQGKKTVVYRLNISQFIERAPQTGDKINHKKCSYRRKAKVDALRGAR